MKGQSSIKETHAVQNKKEDQHIFAPPKEDYVDSLAEECVQPLYDHYFRCQIINEEAVPHRKGREGSPRIFIANHSGMAFPWDAIMLGYALGRKVLQNKEDRKLKNMPRSLSAPALSHMPQMAPYFLPGWWKAGGCVDATFENFDELLTRGYDIVIYPEGIAGIGKGFNRRYRLQRFSTSVVRMSIKHKAQIVPICVVNGEYVNPMAYNVKWINDLARSLGIPYLPIGPLTPLAMTFPFMFYAAMPAQLNFVFCQPLRPSEWTEKSLYENISQDEFEDLAQELRRHVQRRLIKAVRSYGQKPYKIWNFFGHLLFKSGRKKIHLLPFMWPDLFLSHWHKYHGGDMNFFQRVLRFLPYVIPIFGWLILLYQNWPRIAQKGRTIQFALSKKKRRKNQKEENK